MLPGPTLRSAYRSLLRSGHLKPDASQAELVGCLYSLQKHLNGSTWGSNLDQTELKNGIYIHGGVGTGKSRIADLFTATLPSHITRRRTHFFEFMTDIHMRLHHARSQANYRGDPLIQIGQEIQSESSVLCLDEFQVSDIVDAMMLQRLFNSFWNSGGIIVSTSNRHPTELYKNGLNRSLFVPFIEELQRRCLIFKIEGKHDYRMDGKRRKDHQDVFFIDPEIFERVFEEETHGAPFESIKIPVAMGRSLQIDAARPPYNMERLAEKSSKFTASVTFAALCESSVGASDYHALCANADVIYLRGLRKFEAGEVDVVRRFITLVDVAYEFRTRLVCLSSHSMLETFDKVAPTKITLPLLQADSSDNSKSNDRDLKVKGEGGSSSSMMSTFIGDVEWSATGLKDASLSTGGAGETDVRFAIARAMSRLSEMSSEAYDT